MFHSNPFTFGALTILILLDLWIIFRPTPPQAELSPRVLTCEEAIQSTLQSASCTPTTGQAWLEIVCAQRQS